MGFRDDHEALRHRVDALETQLEERDEEVARLRGELEAKPQRTEVAATVSPPAREAAQWTVPATAAPAIPDDDTWKLPRVQRKAPPVVASPVILGLCVGSPLVLHLGGYLGSLEAFVAGCVLTLGAIGLLLHGHEIVADRRTRTVKIVRTGLLRSSRTLAVREQSIFLEKTKSDEDDAVVVGRVYLGEHLLVQRPWDDARGLAERLADFLGAPYGGERPPRRSRGTT